MQVVPILKEIFQVSTTVAKHGCVRFPFLFGNSILNDPKLDSLLNGDRTRELLGQAIIDVVSELGPFYGKAAQTTLSRLSPEIAERASDLHLQRLYGDWPSLAFDEIEGILDEEIPLWRHHLVVNPYPLGVASIAQVHEARDQNGNFWVVKVVKPHARVRLLETTAALDKIIHLLEPIAVGQGTGRVLQELGELAEGLRNEINLDLERKNMSDINVRIEGKNRGVLRIPRLHPNLSSSGVLVCERFTGIPLSAVVSGTAKIDEKKRKKLAKNMLSELLIQVFEVGLFHGDPHAGNLILLEDGSVGIFDWGLAGELTSTDRNHISCLLKALFLQDIEELTRVLMELAEENGGQPDRKAIHSQLKKMTLLVKKAQEKGEKVPFEDLIELALKAATKLDIPVPKGLLLMVKSLLTIEGLAKGIDPNISFTKVASPVLLKASRPGLMDILTIGQKLFSKNFRNSL